MLSVRRRRRRPSTSSPGGHADRDDDARRLAADQAALVARDAVRDAVDLDEQVGVLQRGHVRYERRAVGQPRARARRRRSTSASIARRRPRRGSARGPIWPTAEAVARAAVAQVDRARRRRPRRAGGRGARARRSARARWRWRRRTARSRPGRARRRRGASAAPRPAPAGGRASRCRRRRRAARGGRAARAGSPGSSCPRRSPPWCRRPRGAAARSPRSRSRPWAMILAIIESNSGGTTSPSATPVSTRTPGPVGQPQQRRSRPGAGANPRAGSSALSRTSIAWPRGGGGVALEPAARRRRGAGA